MANLTKSIVAFACLLIISSCKQNPTLKLFKEHINKEISLNGYDSVFLNSTAVSYSEFRDKYKYIQINYIDEDCSICKFKIHKWLEQENNVAELQNIAFVFIFRGDDFYKYIKSTQGVTEFPYLVMQSSEWHYVDNNSGIDRQIIDNGVLLDEKNRIRVIGEPFVSDKMKKLYESVCK